MFHRHLSLFRVIVCDLLVRVTCVSSVCYCSCLRPRTVENVEHRRWTRARVISVIGRSRQNNSGGAWIKVAHGKVSDRLIYLLFSYVWRYSYVIVSRSFYNRLAFPTAVALLLVWVGNIKAFAYSRETNTMVTTSNLLTQNPTMII